MLLRPARAEEATRLAELNRTAYPDLAGDGVVFEASQIEAHHCVFPEGQIVCEIDGSIAGAMATLVVPSKDALEPHSWCGITSNGLFGRHDPTADALYLADVYIDPKAWGKGVGQALYGALFDLCRRGAQRRVVAGGRLWGYHEVADVMSPQAYVDEVVRSTRKDRVLTSQLRAGFVVEGLLERYLDDWRSKSFATLLVWSNRATLRPHVALQSASSNASR
jgi:GNAT superfamily N-acetyltransferase